MKENVHHSGNCDGDFDDDYSIGLDTVGDHVLYENDIGRFQDGDPIAYAIIAYCPFCGKKLKEEE
jgi:hypothetical protein